MARIATRTDRRISKIVREAVNASGKPYPIKIVEGFQEPELTGRSYGWQSATGIWWRGRSGPKWGKTYRYVRSSRKIVVGAGWLIEQGAI